MKWLTEWLLKKCWLNYTPAASLFCFWSSVRHCSVLCAGWCCTWGVTCFGRSISKVLFLVSFMIMMLIWVQVLGVLSKGRALNFLLPWIIEWLDKGQFLPLTCQVLEASDCTEISPFVFVCYAGASCFGFLYNDSKTPWPPSYLLISNVNIC